MLQKIYLNIYLNCPVKKKQHLRFNFAKKNVNHEEVMSQRNRNQSTVPGGRPRSL